MIIPKITNRIQKCLELAESLNLTNKEEENLTLELTYYLKKLIVHLLTKKEKEQYKKKLKLISNPNDLKTLTNLLSKKKKTYKYMPSISVKNNLLFYFFPQSKIAARCIFKEFKQLFKSNYEPKTNNTFYILNISDSLLSSKNINQYFLQFLKKNSLKNLIISAHSLIKIQENRVNISKELVKNIKNTVIIKVNHQSEFKAALLIIKNIKKESKHCNVGISFNIMNRELVGLFYKNISEIKKIQDFTIRINKEFQINGKNQLLKDNTFYKWAVYSMAQLSSKHQLKLLIQSHNIHDISWLLLLRAQRNLENQIQFEINASKHPNIAKILMVINKFNIQSELLFLDSNKREILNIIINKLNYQSGVYKLIKYNQYNISQIFVKSHRQFFNYLKRNYIKLFLKKMNVED